MSPWLTWIWCSEEVNILQWKILLIYWYASKSEELKTPHFFFTQYIIVDTHILCKMFASNVLCLTTWNYNNKIQRKLSLGPPLWLLASDWPRVITGPGRWPLIGWDPLVLIAVCWKPSQNRLERDILNIFCVQVLTWHRPEGGAPRVQTAQDWTSQPRQQQVRTNFFFKLSSSSPKSRPRQQ